MYFNKNYNASDVLTSVIKTITDYMDVNGHELGEDIYISDLEKEIGKVDGVINLIDLRVYNEYGVGYSNTQISQQTIEVSYDNEGIESETDSVRSEIDLDASDYILNSESDEMFEIKNPDNDIRVRLKAR